MSERCTALLLSSRCFDLLSWSTDLDAAQPCTRIVPVAAFRDNRIAVGLTASQWFALDNAEMITDLFGWLDDTSEPPIAFENIRPEAVCAALLGQLRDQAIADGFEPNEPVVVIVPDSLLPHIDVFAKAAAAADLVVDGYIPYSLAACHSSARTSSATRLLCVVEDLALNLALVGAERGDVRLAESHLISGLGVGARNAVLADLVERALHDSGTVINGRQVRRVQIATRALHPPLFGDARPAMLEIDIGSQIYQICVAPGELARRLADERAHAIELVREMFRKLPDDAPPVLLAGEAHDLLWLKRLVTEAVPTASLEAVRLETLAKGALRARTAADDAALPDAATTRLPCLVGLLETNAAGICRFDVLFDSRDPRERAPMRIMNFPDEARIRLFQPNPAGEFQRLGEVHFPLFDYAEGNFEVRFSRVGNGSYQVQCFEPATGHAEIKRLAIADYSRDRSLARDLTPLKLVQPLPMDWF